MDQNEIVSVQVVLKPSTDMVIDGETQITSNNIEDYLPPPNAYALASNILTSLSFEVGPLVGISFSITAKASVFRETFKVGFQKDSKGGIQCVKKNGEISRQLPIEHLPKEIIEMIQFVVCAEPLDFGPNEF